MIFTPAGQFKIDSLWMNRTLRRGTDGILVRNQGGSQMVGMASQDGSDIQQGGAEMVGMLAQNSTDMAFDDTVSPPVTTPPPTTPPPTTLPPTTPPPPPTTHSPTTLPPTTHPATTPHVTTPPPTAPATTPHAFMPLAKSAGSAITRRNDLVKLVKQGAVGVELGVAQGGFSSALQPFFEKLFLVDRWSDHHDENEMNAVVSKFADKANVTIMRSTFQEALPNFVDESLDFIYIDGYAHLGQEDGMTLSDWWPKLKKGGVFSGHDYDDRFPRTKEVVDAFALKQGKTVNVINETGQYPSWWFFK